MVGTMICEAAEVSLTVLAVDNLTNRGLLSWSEFPGLSGVHPQLFVTGAKAGLISHLGLFIAINSPANGVL